MDNFTQVLTVLSSMITPVVLIMANGSLILSTSQRLSREIERTRKLGRELKELANTETAESGKQDEILAIYQQLKRSTRRVLHLQRSMTSLYLSLLFFVATSVSIGVIDILQLDYNWLPVVLVLMGAVLLFYACLELISESRLAFLAVNFEMSRAIKTVGSYFPYRGKNSSEGDQRGG